MSKVWLPAVVKDNRQANQKVSDAVFMGGLHYQLPKESSCCYEMEIICKEGLKVTCRHSLGIIDIGMT